METTAPRNLAGKRDGATRELPINVNIGWTIDRGPLTVAGRSEQLAISVPLTGSLHASGQISDQLGGVTGSLGSALGGNLGRQVENLAGKTFDQRADIRGNVLINAQPGDPADVAHRAQPRRAGLDQRCRHADRRRAAEHGQGGEAARRQLGARSGRGA